MAAPEEEQKDTVLNVRLFDAIDETEDIQEIEQDVEN